MLSGFVAAFVASGWALVRAWDRRNTAARDLHGLAQEARALTEQNLLLAQELTELVSLRLPDGGLAGSGLASDPALFRHPRST